MQQIFSDDIVVFMQVSCTRNIHKCTYACNTNCGSHNLNIIMRYACMTLYYLLCYLTMYYMTVKPACKDHPRDYVFVHGLSTHAGGPYNIHAFVVPRPVYIVASIDRQSFYTSGLVYTVKPL